METSAYKSVLKLLQHESVLGLLQDVLSLSHCARHALGRVREHHVRPESPELVQYLKLFLSNLNTEEDEIRL